MRKLLRRLFHRKKIYTVSDHMTDWWKAGGIDGQNEREKKLGEKK